eukprot:653796_1
MKLASIQLYIYIIQLVIKSITMMIHIHFVNQTILIIGHPPSSNSYLQIICKYVNPPSSNSYVNCSECDDEKYSYCSSCDSLEMYCNNGTLEESAQIYCGVELNYTWTPKCDNSFCCPQS